MAVLGKVIMIPWMVISIILLVGVTIIRMACNYILGTVGDPPNDGGQPSSDWWVTNFGMVGGPPGDGW